jgi:hypothetical protein
MDAKRTYANQFKLIIASNNKIIALDKDHEILANYLLVSNKIIKQKYQAPEQFIESMVSEILKPWFIDSIKTWVRKQYKAKCQSIDVMERFDPATVFTDEHAILLYQIAHVFRFIIPLATHFAKIYSDMISMQDTSEFYIDAYGNRYKNTDAALQQGQKLFNKTTFLLSVMNEVIYQLTKDQPDMNIYGKLNYYVTNLVKSTAFSDSEMWNKLIMRSTSKYNQIDIIMAKILIDIIPKAIFDKAIIKFIVFTIEQHIKWAFRIDFNINYNMITPMNADSDFSDADKFDINSVKQDELKKILQQNFMDDTIDIIFERKGFVIDIGEYNWYLKNNKPSSIQDTMIRNFFAHEFGGYDNLEGLNIFQYTRLLVYMTHFITDSKQYRVLQHILTGDVVTINEKRLLPKPIERKIRESIRYQTIMNKYSYTGDIVKKSNVLEQIIITVLNSKILYNKYTGKRNGETIELDIDICCDDVLKFVEAL